jgi:mRNA interferase MazF
MVAFGFASVVLVEFPFTDLSQTKLRPALVLAQATKEDWILCQITSNFGIDNKAIEIKDADFTQGSLRQISYARPNKIFTGHESLIEKRVGVLHKEKASAIVEAVVKILRR